jgi:hypothetical protein
MLNKDVCKNCLMTTNDGGTEWGWSDLDEDRWNRGTVQCVCQILAHRASTLSLAEREHMNISKFPEVLRAAESMANGGTLLGYDEISVYGSPPPPCPYKLQHAVSAGMEDAK